MCRQNAAIAPASVVVVSPCTITAAGRRSANSASSCLIISVSSSGWQPVTRSSGQSHVGRLLERGERLGDHRRVLAAGDQYRSHPAGGAHGRDDGGELDGFRPGTGDEVHFRES